MKYYTGQGLSASGLGPATAINAIGSAAIRPLIRLLTFGFRTNPNATDQQVRVQAGNTTAAGTAGSSPVPKPNDPQDVAAVTTLGIAHSVEPTYAATFFIDTDLNQRASKDFFYEEGRELAGAAVASNGVAAKMALVTAALVMSCVKQFRE
jgi:hypothetical protein